MGAVKTTVDYLKGQAKKDYMNNSEVKVTNMFDNIENVPSREELLSMDKEKAKNICLALKDRFSMKELADHWGVKSQNTAYIVFYKTGAMIKNQIRINSRIQGEVTKRNNKASNIENNTHSNTVIDKPTTGIDSAINDFLKKLASEIDELKEKKDIEGYNLTFCGLFNKEIIENKLMNILTTLDNESDYELTFKLREIPKNK